MKKKSDLLWVIVVAVFVIMGYPPKCICEAQHRQNSNLGVQRYCGRNLVNILTLVCDGVYNHMIPKEGHDTESAEGADIKMPQLRSRRSALTFNPGSVKRNRRGAYDECCRKGCSIGEMVGYCGGQ